MLNKILRLYTFDPDNRTITFQDGITVSNISSIVNATDNILIYSKNNSTRGGTISGNVLTLFFNTRGMQITDKLEVLYDVNDDQAISSQTKSFSDGFSLLPVAQQPLPSRWNTNNTNNEHLVNVGGNAVGSNYLRIILNPLVENSEVTLTSKEVFSLSTRLQTGLSMSQRVFGEEVFIGLVEDNGAGGIQLNSSIPDKAITGSTISVTTNVATVTLTNHGLQGGDRISIFGCADSRLNLVPTVVTVVDANTFTYPLTIANGTYNSTGGSVRISEPLRYANNGVGYLWENTTAGQASQVMKSNGGKSRNLNSTHGTTVGNQTNTSPYTDAFNPATIFEQDIRPQEVLFRSFAVDSVATPGGMSKFNIATPIDSVNYRIHIRARRLTSVTRVIAEIATTSKSGTTTETITTIAPHGLSVNDWIQRAGTRDIANFPNLTVQTQVASIISSTQFTVVTAGAVTANSTGGVIWRVNGGNTAPGLINLSIQSIQRTSNVLSVTCNTTVSGLLSGEYVYLYGLDGSGAPYDAAFYKVLRQNATILELESIGSDFGLINCGGAIIKTTDVRIHFLAGVEYSRNITEISGGKGNATDISNAVGVSVVNTPGLAAGTALIGDVGIQYRATGGASALHIISVAGANATIVKAAAGKIVGWALANTTASWRYVKIHAQATLPTAGAGVVRTISIAPNSVATPNFEGGIAVATGIGITIVTGSADSDSTGVAAGDVVGELIFA
jgi:hypothetical protein